MSDATPTTTAGRTTRSGDTVTFHLDGSVVEIDASRAAVTRITTAGAEHVAGPHGGEGQAPQLAHPLGAPPEPE